jgi:hypothetical protein
VNGLLFDLGWRVPVVVSSGWRPRGLNAKIKGAAKNSYHIYGKAVDIADNGELDRAIQANPALLEKWGLWLEHPDNTPGWTHLDVGTRTDRDIRIFKP